ncbi:uncharacterized protein ACNLHF_003456 [Anomaloglossus baeobatrachus]|uniref:uncharacterized protein LOC142258536 n=1 Tax=Anomaloglossus baeobatrachus TaxID=238106 RepID=UPI003F4F586D
MDSMVTVFEVQNDCSVKQHEVALKFPRVSKRCLYMVTSQNTQLYLLNKEGDDQKKSIFQHGVSTKVLTVTGTTWEVRIVLSPSEISRLVRNFNMMGFIISCLMVKSYQDSLSSLCGHQKRQKADVEELSKAAAQFLSSSEDHIVIDYRQKLNAILTTKIQLSRTGQDIGDKVIGALVALMAAELATSVGGISDFDYRVQKDKKQEDQKEEIKKMMDVFGVMVDLLTVTHQGKRVQIIFRNPCPDNWALGGKKPVHSEDTFVFGLGHKMVSISEGESEVQFLQNLQESYDLISVFHLPALVENLLMTSAWRNKIELFLKKQDERKEIIHELSSLALTFICNATCQKKTFMKEFQREMSKKWSKVDVFSVSDEVICSFGILIAILAALTAKSIVDKPIPDSEDVEEEELVDPITSSSSSAGSSSTLLDKSSNSHEGIVTEVTIQYGGPKPDLDSSHEELAKVERESGEAGICDVKNTIDRTNDPEKNDQRSTDGSLKNDDPVAEPPSIGTLEIADQDADNGNNIDKEDTEKPSAKLVDLIVSSAPSSDGSSSTSLDDSLKLNTKGFEEYGEAKLDLDSNSDDWVKLELESDVVGVCDAKSKIGITNDTGMTEQRNSDGSLKNDNPEIDLPGVGTRGSAAQKVVDDDDKEDPVRPAAKLVDSFASSTPFFAGSSGILLDDSLNLSEVMDTRKTDEYSVAKPDLDNSPSDWFKVELESGEVSTWDAKSKIGSNDDQDVTDQRSIDGPVVDLPGVDTLGMADSETNNDDVDENIHRHTEATDFERSTTSPEVEDSVHSHGSGPSLNEYSDDGTFRVAQPPSVEAQNTGLEKKDSSFRNRIFKTGFMGLMCLLVVAMLTNVLPQSLSSALVAIILGLLVVKWLVRRQP